jgi:hypothetical protein
MVDACGNDNARPTMLNCGAHRAHQRCAEMLAAAGQNCSRCEPTGPRGDVLQCFVEAERQRPDLFEDSGDADPRPKRAPPSADCVEHKGNVRRVDARGLDSDKIAHVVDSIAHGLCQYVGFFCQRASACSSERPFLDGCYNYGELKMLLDHLESAATRDPLSRRALTLAHYPSLAVGAEHNALVRRALESLLLGSEPSRRLVPPLATLSGPRRLEDTSVYGGAHYHNRIGNYQQVVRELHLADSPLVLTDETMFECEQFVLQKNKILGRLFAQPWARALLRFELAKSQVAVSVDLEGAYAHRGLRHSFVCNGTTVLGSLTTPLPNVEEAQLHPRWRHSPGRREAEIAGQLLPYSLLERAIQIWVKSIPATRRAAARCDPKRDVGGAAPRVHGARAARRAKQSPYETAQGAAHENRLHDASLARSEAARRAPSPGPPASEFDVNSFFA